MAPALSSGAYQMDTYRCVTGTRSANYPSAWYAFSWARRGSTCWTRLGRTAIWARPLFKNDHDYHWCATCAEHQWLASDLAAHPGGLKLAVLHFPMYSDNATETTDSYLHWFGQPGQRTRGPAARPQTA